ncbi:MAG: hypothetical protein C5B57_07940, partial [Blastocatellia bacterium]
LAIHRWLPFGGAYPLAFFLNRVGDTNMLVRREAFFSAGGFDEERGAGLFEDWTFFSKAMVRGLRIETVPEPLYLYRLGTHGFGQRSPSYNSYPRTLRPFLNVLPSEVGLAVLYAAGAYRRSLGGESAGSQIVEPNHEQPRRVRIQDRLHRWLVKRLNPSNAGVAEGDQLTEVFVRSAPVAAFGRGQSAVLVPLYQAQVHQLDGALRLLATGDEPQLALNYPGSALLTRGPLVVRLDMTTSRDTITQLFWKTPNVPIYCEQQSVRTRLDPGRNIRYLRIPAQRILGRIRFDPAAHAGEVTLHSLRLHRE